LQNLKFWGVTLTYSTVVGLHGSRGLAEGPCRPLHLLHVIINTTTKIFLVAASNRSLVLASESNTLYVIQKIAHFLCRLLSTDIKDAFFYIGCHYGPTPKIDLLF
jgi:hypothetical protein